MKYLTLSLFILSSFILVGKPHAETLWQKDEFSKIKVLQSDALSETMKEGHLIGIHIKMRKNWKTYWRRPGDAGIPPYFDWKNSENLKEATVLWPAPYRMKDAYSLTIGYKDEVVFPIVIKAKDKSKPVRVKLAFNYGVCLDICVPETKNLSFDIPGAQVTSIKSHQLLSKFYKMIPQIVRLKHKDKALPSVMSVKTDLNGKAPYMEIHAKYPDGAEIKDIFVEASDGFFIVEPVMDTQKSNASTNVYRIDLSKGDKAAELKGKTITATLVSDKGQTETKWIVQ